MSDHCRARTIPVTGSTAAEELAALRERLREKIAEWRECVPNFHLTGWLYDKLADEIEALLSPPSAPDAKARAQYVNRWAVNAEGKE